MKPSEALAALLWEMRRESMREFLVLCEKRADGSYVIPPRTAEYIDKHVGVPGVPYETLSQDERQACEQCALRIQKLYLGEVE